MRLGSYYFRLAGGLDIRASFTSVRNAIDWLNSQSAVTPALEDEKVWIYRADGVAHTPLLLSSKTGKWYRA